MRMDWMIRFGIFVTALIFLVSLVFSLFDTCSEKGGAEHCQMRLKAFWYSPANEVGDALAGFAGGLALLWIIITVLLQGKQLAAQQIELKLTRDELSEQRKATQDMAEAQRRQVELLKAQGAIFEDEQRQRKEEQVRRVLEQRLERLRNAINAVEWQFSGGSRSDKFWLFVAAKNTTKLNLDDYFCQQFDHLSKMSEKLSSDDQKIICEAKFDKDNLKELQNLVRSIEKLKDDLAEDQKERLEKIGIFEMRENLYTLSKLPIWGSGSTG